MSIIPEMSTNSLEDKMPSVSLPLVCSVQGLELLAALGLNNRCVLDKKIPWYLPSFSCSVGGGPVRHPLL